MKRYYYIHLYAVWKVQKSKGVAWSLPAFLGPKVNVKGATS